MDTEDENFARMYFDLIEDLKRISDTLEDLKQKREEPSG